ncbi:MAG: hypothetical protein QM749_19435 [Aquabacterium sp.]
MKTRSLAAAAVSFIALVAVVLTAHGLWQQTWPGVLPWNGMAAFHFYLRVMALLAAWFGVLIVLLGVKPLKAWVLSAGAVAVLTGQVASFAVVLLFAVASHLIGQSVIRKLGADAVERRGLVVPFLVGAGLIGTVVGLVAHRPWSYPGLYWVALLLPIVRWRDACVHLVRQVWARIDQAEQPGGLGLRVLDVALATIVTLHLLVALMPEVGFDALAVHLFVPGRLASATQWGFDPSKYAWALIPMLGDWVVSPAYLLAGESACKLSNFLFLLVLMKFTQALVEWAGGSATAVRFANLLLLTTPLVFGMNSTLQIEMIWSSFALGGLLVLLTSIPHERQAAGNDLVVAGMLMGMGIAAKAVVLTLLPVWGLVALARPVLRRQGWPIGRVAQAVSVFLLLGAIPYYTAWRKTGNPVFPFFNSVFKSHYFPPVDFDNALYKTKLTWRILYDFNFLPANYMESTIGGGGWHWLLLPAALLGACLLKNKRALALTLLMAGTVLLVFRSQSYLRYVFPVFPMLASVVAVQLTAWAPATSRWPLRANVLVLLATVAVNLAFISSANWNYRSLPMSVLLNDAERQAYLMWRAPIRLAIDVVNKVNPAGAPVTCFTTQTYGAGLRDDALFIGWYNDAFNSDVLALSSAQDVANLLRKHGSSTVILDDNWSTPAIRAYVRDATTEIASLGPISVRRAMVPAANQADARP